MKELAYWLLLVACMGAYATCWTAFWACARHDASRWRHMACILGCLGTVVAGGTLHWVLGIPGPRSLFGSAPMVMVSGNLVYMVGFVWWKRRLRHSGEPLRPFWDAVYDDYPWRLGRRAAGTEDAATELEAAEAPVGRGTEPEASSAPAGRGDELVGLIQAGDADTSAEDARSPSRAGLSERTGPPRA